MFKLLALVFPFAATAGFACGYGVREWISNRRRKEARSQAHNDPTGRHLSTIERRIADTTSEIKALRDEAQRELAAIRNLLEQKSEVGGSIEEAVTPPPTIGTAAAEEHIAPVRIRRASRRPLRGDA